MAIAADPEIHAEAKRVWRPLRDLATSEAGEEGVMRVVAKRFAIYPQPERSPAEWSAWWDVYIDALGDLPEASLELGLQAYVKGPDAEFLPKPGRIRELAKVARTPAAIAAERAARAAAYEPGRVATYVERLANLRRPAERVPPGPEERELIHKMAKETAAILAQTVERRRPPPAKFTQAKTDEKGITAEMRELMDRQREHHP